MPATEFCVLLCPRIHMYHAISPVYGDMPPVHSISITFELLQWKHDCVQMPSPSSPSSSPSPVRDPNCFPNFRRYTGSSFLLFDPTLGFPEPAQLLPTPSYIVVLVGQPCLGSVLALKGSDFSCRQNLALIMELTGRLLGTDTQLYVTLSCLVQPTVLAHAHWEGSLQAWQSPTA